jgi:hypothetical protein
MLLLLLAIFMYHNYTRFFFAANSVMVKGSKVGVEETKHRSDGLPQQEHAHHRFTPSKRSALVPTCLNVF